MAKIRKSKEELAGDAVKQLSILGRLGVPMAAAYLKIHPYTLKDYISRGYMDSIKIGDRYFITGNELERFKREGKPVKPPKPKEEEYGT